LPGKEEKDAESSYFMPQNVKNGSVLKQHGYCGNFWVVAIIY